MNGIGIIAWVAASLPGSLGLSGPSPKPGDQHEIIVSYETSNRTSDGSSGSSRGGDAVLERVIAVGEDGLELEFDLPSDATAEQRTRQWKYPARIVLPTNGPPRLLNADELEARVDAWFAAGGMTRESCGRWIFTWNAFRIECDPQSVLADVEAFDLRVPTSATALRIDIPRQVARAPYRARLTEQAYQPIR